MFNLIKFAAVGVVALAASVVNADVRLQGAGATFPNPIYQKWVTEYGKLNPTIKIDYQSIGSGGGIKGLTEKTIDFAGSDAPLSRSEREKIGAEAVHIPTVAGAVVLAYNLPGVSGDVKLTGDLVADIFMGKVTNWNDPKIAAINEGIAFPNLAITPVYRTDGSGTTFVFTNYLGTQSESFKENVGMGKAVKWPLGQGGKGNEGVSAGIQGSAGALGYVELNYASANKIPFALLKNTAGEFVKASPESVTLAGAGAINQMDTTLAVDIWNQDAAGAYPIAAFTYIIVRKDLGDLDNAAEAKALVDFLAWAVTDGEKMAGEMSYSPLAEAVQEKAKAAIGTLTFKGSPVK